MLQDFWNNAKTEQENLIVNIFIILFYIFIKKKKQKKNKKLEKLRNSI